MRESGYYPAGAEFDPRSPWNQSEPTMVECGACGGKGYHWYAYDLEADHETECTEQTWEMLPDTEEEASAKRMHFIKGEKEVCEVCEGQGEVEYEPDYDDYDDDRDEY